MNEASTTKSCPKHQVELDAGYCPVCYPHPRVFCKGTKSNGEPCRQPLTNPKHREREMGARCWKNKIREEETLRNAKLKDEVPYVEYIRQRKYSSLEDLF